MKENFESSFKLMLGHEGGFVNHPRDPGGMTNLGVTKRVYETWVKREVSEKEMRALRPDDVRDLYKKMYWDACRCDELPSGIDHSVFDFAVNAGPKRSIITLQRAANVKDDGILGPGTLKAVNEANPTNLMRLFAVNRMNFYKGLKNFEVFGKGWGNRTMLVFAESEDLFIMSQPKEPTDSKPSPS